MNQHFKKTLSIALAGAFLLTSAAAYQMPGLSSAAPYQMQHADKMPSHMNKMFNETNFAQAIAAEYNVKQTDVEKALQNGWRPFQLQRAAFIAYASDKSLNDVLSDRDKVSSWQELDEKYGLTPEKHDQAMRQLHCKRIADMTGVTETKLNALIDDGYYMHDITMAALIANEANRSIDDVISQKKINNSWFDIAESFGMNPDDLSEKMHQCRPHHFDRGFGGHDAGYNGVSRHGGWHHRSNHRSGDCYYGDNCGGRYHH